MAKVIHMHVPKCGGTSLLVSFRENFGNNQVLKKDHPKKQDFENNRLILSGHFPYIAGYEHLQWVTFVRHPIARLQSFYYYKQMKSRNKRVVNDYWWNIIKTKSLEQWLECEESKNMMVKQFAGKAPTDEIEQGDFKIAFKNINNFFFIGVQENYDEDIRKLYKKLGKTIKDVPHKLKSANPPTLMYEQFYGNTYDIELYNSILSKDDWQ